MQHINDYSLNEVLTPEQLEAVQAFAKCKDAGGCVKHLIQIIDGNASCEEIKDFEAHITDCKACFEEYTTLQNIQDIIAKSVKKRCCPDKFKEEITKKLATL